MGMTRIRNRGEGMQLEIRGATVDVTVSGNSGRGVLLLHGFMCSAQMMSSVQEALCGQMRVAAIDFPGHGKNGRSAPPPKPSAPAPAPRSRPTPTSRPKSAPS